MKSSSSVFRIALAAFLSAALAAGGARAAGVRCDSGSAHPLSGKINGDVSVPVGGSCVIDGAEIFGSVRVYWNASIAVYRAHIHGDFSAVGATAVRFNALGEELGARRGRVAVDGDVIIKESHFTRTSGFGDGTTIGRDLTLKRNHAAEKGVVFVICPAQWCRAEEPVRVSGDVGIKWNRVPILVNNLHVGGDLNCRDNSAPLDAPPNATEPRYDIRFRKATGQCARLGPQ